MRCAKRFLGLFLPVLALVAVGFLVPGAAQATVTPWGDVFPTAMSSWGSGTDGFVGYNTSDGSITVNSGDLLASKNGYLGYSYISATDTITNGTVTVTGGTWTNNCISRRWLQGQRER